MYKLLQITCFLLGIYAVQGQSCINYNMPAPPGDDCTLAPLLCGNYLLKYCSSNTGLSNDTLGATIVENSGFLRVFSCNDSIHLDISVKNCQQGTGLNFWLMGGNCSDPELSTPIPIAENTQGAVVFNLVPDSTYYLVFGGTDVCEFTIDTLSGIGTAQPAGVSCNCTGGFIDGPEELCPGDMATYTVTLPQCSYTFLPGTEGNGYYCCPNGGSSQDSLHLIWHVPQGLVIMGDSVDVLSITVQVDSAFLGVDTTFTGNIFVSFGQISPPGPAAPADSLMFCDCTTLSCTGGGISGMNVTISHDVEHSYCILTCMQNFCEGPDGQIYTSPGIFITQTNCTTSIFEIIANWDIPFVFIPPPPPICAGSSAILTVVGGNTSMFYSWSNGQTGMTITVSPIVSTTYQVTVTDVSNGCTTSAAVLVTVIPFQTINLGEVAQLSCTTPCVTYMGTQYCTPGTYQVYSGACQTTTFSIGMNPTIPTVTLPAVTLCEGQCYTHNGQEYCSSTTFMYTENCTLYSQEVVVNPAQVVNLGTVGMITCANPCFTFQGGNYCTAGQYSDTSNCVITHFTIGSDLVAPAYSGLTEICQPDNNSYRVSFSISGTPPFKVNSTVLSGTYFQSAPIANGTPYTFIIEQSTNGCQTLANGTYDCALACSNVAAMLSSNLLKICGNTTVTPEVVTPAVVGAGSSTEFILHSNPSGMSGGVIARNSSGAFSFDASSMQHNQQYYISNVTGPVGAAGAVDLGNICTKISTGQPVMFYKKLVFGHTDITQPTCFGQTDGVIHFTNIENGALLDFNAAGFRPTTHFEQLSGGTYPITLRDEVGCTADTTIQLVTPDSLWLTTLPDQDIHAGDWVVLTANTNAQNATPIWTNESTLVSQNAANWTVQPSETTRFACSVTTAEGCQATASVLVNLLKEGIYHPNIIATNDPDNQWFSLYAADRYVQKILQLTVFDRWGNVVFERHDFEANMPELGWNGTVNGKMANPEVFAFVAQIKLYDGSLKHISGDITVVR